MKRLIILAAAGMAFASPAWAADWNNGVNGFQGGIGGTNYVAVDTGGNYVPSNQVNSDGSFKGTCVGCYWRQRTLTDTPAANDAKYTTPYAYAANPANGSFTEIGADGLVIGNGSLILNGDNVGQHLSIHDAILSQHASLLERHSATLTAHGKRLDEQEKGIAIAVAMPDAWLGDKDRFAIAGNIGGFGDETALGFAAIGRLSETWSVNAKVGSDTNFEQFGWTVGARAGW